MGFWSSLLGGVGAIAGSVIPGVGTIAGATVGGALGAGIGGAADASEASDDADKAFNAQKDAAFAKTFKPMGSEPPASSPLMQTGSVGGGGGMAPYSDDILDELERKYGRKGAA